MKLLRFILTILLSLCPTFLEAAQTQEYSIFEFVSIENQWNSLIGKPLRIEGRYTSFSPSGMRFRNCDLPFLLPSKSVPPNRRTKTMEVTGTLKKEKNELVFQVKSFRVLQEDQDTTFRKKSVLPKNNPASWYQLGKKTVQRGKFYDDQRLQKLGETILFEAIQIEKKQQKNISSDFLVELAAKSSTLGLANRVRTLLIFEACQLQFPAAIKSPDYDFSSLKNLMEKQLPGSLIPLTSLEGTQFDQFRKSPLATYEPATDHARRQLSRLFYLQVVREEFQRQLSTKGGSGDAIALKYEKIAPDDPNTIKLFREQALMFRSKNITTARRNEVLEVAKQYRDQKNEQMANTVLETWLKHRVTQLDRAGPSDYLTTALDYEQWFSNPEKSVEILIAGIKRFPEDKALKEELVRRDFVEKDDQWVARKSLPATKMNKIQKAIQSGRIVTGMTREQVANSLGGPKTISRIASARQTVLVWNYPDARLAVRFTQRQKSSDYIVVAVTTLGSR